MWGWACAEILVGRLVRRGLFRNGIRLRDRTLSSASRARTGALSAGKRCAYWSGLPSEGKSREAASRLPLAPTVGPESGWWRLVAPDQRLEACDVGRDLPDRLRPLPGQLDGPVAGLQRMRWWHKDFFPEVLTPQCRCPANGGMLRQSRASLLACADVNRRNPEGVKRGAAVRSRRRLRKPGETLHRRSTSRTTSSLPSPRAGPAHEPSDARSDQPWTPSADTSDEARGVVSRTFRRGDGPVGTSSASGTPRSLRPCTSCRGRR